MWLKVHIYRLTLATPLQNGQFYFSVMQQPLAAMTSSLPRLHDYIKTPHTRYDHSGRVIISSQRPLSDNTQQTYYVNAPAGFEFLSERPQTHVLNRKVIVVGDG